MALDTKTGITWPDRIPFSQEQRSIAKRIKSRRDALLVPKQVKVVNPLARQRAARIKKWSV